MNLIYPLLAMVVYALVYFASFSKTISLNPSVLDLLVGGFMLTFDVYFTLKKSKNLGFFLFYSLYLTYIALGFSRLVGIISTFLLALSFGDELKPLVKLVFIPVALYILCGVKWYLPLVYLILLDFSYSFRIYEVVRIGLISLPLIALHLGLEQSVSLLLLSVALLLIT
jgi:hypothetical protein